jgi:hypothetical protein
MLILTGNEPLKWYERPGRYTVLILCLPFGWHFFIAFKLSREVKKEENYVKRKKLNRPNGFYIRGN